MTFSDYIRRWIIGIGLIIDGILMLLSLGFVRTQFTLKLAKRYSRKRWLYENE